MRLSQAYIQPKVAEKLEKKLEENRLAHAYLFLGDKGVGKTKTAVYLAMLLNCIHNVPLEFCDECSSCTKIKHNNHPDVEIIVPENNSIKIEQIRNLRKKVQLKSYEGKTKVIIIKDAHLLTPEAANSLLKILEEPPNSSLFILTAPDGLRILPTILSRCQTIQFNNLCTDEIKNILVSDGIENNIAVVASNLSKGSLGRAYELINNPEMLLIRKKIIDMLLKMPNIKHSEIFSLVESFEKEKEAISFVLEIIIYWYRDLALYKIVGHDELLINQDYLEQIKVNNLKLESCLTSLEYGNQVLAQIKRNANYKLALEVLLLKINSLFC